MSAGAGAAVGMEIKGVKEKKLEIDGGSAIEVLHLCYEVLHGFEGRRSFDAQFFIVLLVIAVHDPVIVLDLGFVLEFPDSGLPFCEEFLEGGGGGHTVEGG
jgi:hypothetical protein